MRLLVVLMIALSIESARAGPPFITDDPDPVEYKHWEVYLFSIYNRINGAEQGQFPAMEINYGVLPSTQLHLIVPISYDHQPGDVSHYGMGDR